jgi:caffeoyl-CoA O-methyltransferase
VIVSTQLDQYAAAHSAPEPPYLAALAAETRERFPRAHGMMVGAVEGQFLALMASLVGARRVLEIGTFTGYSSLAMAGGLPPGGTIVTCDVNPDHVAVARRHIEASPFAGRIEIRLGPALETLDTLPGPFDLVFVDADKGSYANYYEAVLPKLADGGVVLVDNVLWDGRVLDATDDDAETRAIAAFNDTVRDDPRVTSLMLPIRDGITVIRRASPTSTNG